jgi:Spy/CpxP family protein refolding chaperone
MVTRIKRTRRTATIGASMAVLAAAGFAVIAPGTASANAACNDFLMIMSHYYNEGDFATADAMWANLMHDGCF